MDLQQLVVMLVIGAVAGWLAGMVVGKGLGLVGNIVVGILGAVVGGWLFRQMGISIGGEAWVDALVTSTAGAVILLVVVGLVKR